MIERTRSSSSSTIAQRLTILVVLAVLPVVVFASMMVWHFACASEANQQTQMQATARALSLAIDREIALQQTTAILLSGSRSPVTGTLAGFYQRARDLLGTDRDRWIMLYDADANLILSTDRPFGTPLPQPTFTAPVLEVVRTARPVVSDLGTGAITHGYMLGIYVPLFDGGSVRYVLGVGFSPQRISDLLLGQHLPAGWTASVFGRNGVIIGHSRDADGHVGRPASAAVQRQLGTAPEGFDAAVDPDGTTVEFAHVRSALSGWSVGMAVEKAALEGPLRAALMQIAAGGLLLLLSASPVAVTYGRMIVAPISALAAAAAALSRGDRPERLELGMQEAQRVADAIDAAATLIEQRGQERETLLKTLEQRVEERTRELRDSEAQLRQLATTDSLTGLPNRRRFDEVFATIWRQAQREETPVSLLMIDADHFKSYNDHYGHEAGDDCLRAVAGAIESLAVRAGDFAARYGGEEFLVLLANTEAEGALTVAERIHAAISELNMPHAGSPFRTVTVSIGTATTFPQQNEDRIELIRRADRNLYAAKHAGRARIEAGELV